MKSRFRGSVLALLILAAAADAQTAADATAKARAALAVSKVRPAAAPVPALAPPPRPLDVFDTYQPAKAEAVTKNRPAVIYVGCDAGQECVRVPGAVTARVDAIAGYPRGTVLVCFPRGGHLWVHRTLACQASPADVIRATREADATKDRVPASAPAPKSGVVLDWS